MEETPFHKIVRGELPSRKIYEDESFLAFLDLYPLADGHTMVIPKKYYKRVWDMPEEEIGEYFKVCKKIANHFQNVTGNEIVYSIIMGRGVEYAHIHIIPSSSESFASKLHEVLESMEGEMLNDDKGNLILSKYSLIK